MQESARLQAAIEAVQQFENTNESAENFIRGFFRARRYAGSKDRAAITARLYAILRQRGAFAWRMGSDDARALVIASLIAEGLGADAIAQAFDGSSYGPAPLRESERQALAAPPPGSMPAWAQGSYPAWLEDDLTRAFGDGLGVAMAAMQGRAPIDLRVNTLKSTREAVLEDVRAMGFDAAPTPFSPWGVRLAAGSAAAKLGSSEPFTAGAFEFQDEAAQIAARLCGVAPGMRVLDLAAGAGGKALALAAMMENQGLIAAYDIAAKRLAPLTARSQRAGVGIVRLLSAPPSGPYDLVLVDAPCSGTGTWRRQPELRWRLTAARLAELIAIQDGLLEQAAMLVAPGGRLVYATCSLLGCENQDRIAAFLDRHPTFAVVPATAGWSGPPLPARGDFFQAAPHVSGTDGFFTAILRADG